MAISFNSIPINLSTPGVFVEFDNSRAGTANQRHRVLLVGTKTGGTAKENELTYLPNIKQATQAFGADSQLAEMHTALGGGLEVWGLAIASLSGTSDALKKLAEGIVKSMASEQFNTIVLPTTNQAFLKPILTELDKRWGPLDQNEGHAFCAVKGTITEMTKAIEGINSPHLTIIGAGLTNDNPELWAAAVAGVDARQADPARPRQTLALIGVNPPQEGFGVSRDERNRLLQKGISTYTVDAGGTARIERLVTTYTTNPQGLPDASYQDLTTMRTLAYLRFSLRARVLQKFPRHKLAASGTTIAPGQAIVTPNILRGEFLALAREWEEQGLVENLDQFKQDLLVERDQNNPSRINAVIPPDIINGFRVLAAQVQFRL